MDILVIDRDTLTNQLLSSKLTARGHTVLAEPNKNIAFEYIRENKPDVIMVDPAPLSEARPVVIGIWKQIRSETMPYMLLLSKTEARTEDAIFAGTNDVLHKPLSTQDVVTKIDNAARYLEIGRWLAREDNIHSGGGLIGKAAFYQLFLAAKDRAFRYGEKSLLAFATITNVEEMLAPLDAEQADALEKKFAQKMNIMRRQSDVAARLGQYEFALLLQRPLFEAEPVEAMNRFTLEMEKFFFMEKLPVAPVMRLQLVEVPQGALRDERVITLAAPGARLDDGI